MEATLEQKKIMAEFIAEINGGDFEEYLPDFSGVDFVSTADPLCAFDGSQWNASSDFEESRQGGLPARYFEEVQAVKGQPRFHLWIVDFGDFRLCHKR